MSKANSEARKVPSPIALFRDSSNGIFNIPSIFNRLKNVCEHEVIIISVAEELLVYQYVVCTND